MEKESSIARFFKHPFGLGSKDPVQEHIIDPIKEHVPDPKKDIRKLEQEDPLNLKPLKRSEYQSIM